VDFVQKRVPEKYRGELYASLKMLESFPEMYRKTDEDECEIVVGRIVILYHVNIERKLAVITNFKFQAQEKYR